MRALLAIVALLLAFAVWAQTPKTTARLEKTRCPVCRAEGILLPDEDTCGHPECAEYRRSMGIRPERISRLAVGDCSLWSCYLHDATEHTEPELLFLDLPLYRCPRDGLLFTEPGE